MIYTRDLLKPIAVDLSGLGRREDRERLGRWVKESGHSYHDLSDFWPRFRESADRPSLPGRTLVMGDLANVIGHYREWDPREWITAVRKARPYFLVFVRTRRDERYASSIDDLMRHSDLRVTVCSDLAQKEEVRKCLAEALTALDPRALTELRFSEGRDGLWVAFGDGLSGFVSWADLGIAPLLSDVIAESAGIGENGETIEIARRDGDLMELDADSVRSILDADYRRDLIEQAEGSDRAVGLRIRAARQGNNLTQRELGERAGLDQAVLSRLERGKHQPRFDTLNRIAEAMGLSVSDLLSGR